MKHDSVREGNPMFYTYLEKYSQLSTNEEASLYDLTTYQTASPTNGTNFKIQDAVIQTVNYNHEITNGNLIIDNGNVGIGTTDLFAHTVLSKNQANGLIIFLMIVIYIYIISKLPIQEVIHPFA